MVSPASPSVMAVRYSRAAPADSPAVRVASRRASSTRASSVSSAAWKRSSAVTVRRIWPSGAASKAQPASVKEVTPAASV